jgi:hypothetical protein
MTTTVVFDAGHARSALVDERGARRHAVVTAVVKRTFDLVVATASLFVAAPLLVVLAVAVRATSPGPALFRQIRVGRGGRFSILKLPTMCGDAVSQLGSNPSLRDAYVHNTSGFPPRWTRDWFAASAERFGSCRPGCVPAGWSSWASRTRESHCGQRRGRRGRRLRFPCQRHASRVTERAESRCSPRSARSRSRNS